MWPYCSASREKLISNPPFFCLTRKHKNCRIPIEINCDNIAIITLIENTLSAVSYLYLVVSGCCGGECQIEEALVV